MTLNGETAADQCCLCSSRASCLHPWYYKLEWDTRDPLVLHHRVVNSGYTIAVIDSVSVEAVATLSPVWSHQVSTLGVAMELTWISALVYVWHKHSEL